MQYLTYLKNLLKEEKNVATIQENIIKLITTDVLRQVNQALTTKNSQSLIEHLGMEAYEQMKLDIYQKLVEDYDFAIKDTVSASEVINRSKKIIAEEHKIKFDGSPTRLANNTKSH